MNKKFYKYCYCFLFVLIAVFGSNLQAQQQDTSFLSYRSFAAYELKELKSNGALVVILKTSNKSAAAYRKAGKTELADKIEDNLTSNSNLLYRAFTQNFKFCPVYFILGDSLTAFQKGKRSNIFVDSTFSVNPVLGLKNDTKCVIANLGAVVHKIDNGGTFEPVGFKSEVVGNIDPNEGYTTAEEALVVYDLEMKQYRWPFPYYVAMKFGVKYASSAVERLQKKFEKSYEDLVVN